MGVSLSQVARFLISRRKRRATFKKIETFEKCPYFVIPAPAFARANSSGNPEGIERTGYRLSPV
ncbi:hypothetical protein D4S03_05035 [bacterium]|nr:MAG: hypothetical protein D4S03_05035 [bacterium]